jgi:transposase-like protein
MQRGDWQGNLPSMPMRVKSVDESTQVVALDSVGCTPGRRRKFSAIYKAQILHEINNAPYGQQIVILRREDLNPSHIQKWEKQRDTAGLEPQKRGRKPNPHLAETKELQKQNAKLVKELELAQAIIEFQKKIAKINQMYVTGAKR